jgi:putative exosortase-associated protein (TIGR04073 family)
MPHSRLERIRSSAAPVAFAALALALLLPAAAWGEEYTAARKIGRGLAAMTLGVLEIPGNIVQESRTNGPVSGATIGLAMGLGKFVTREAVGVYEFLTAPFELPAGFKPVLEPEFPWQYFESQPGRAYGFTENYLPEEELEISKIPGAVVSRRRGALLVQFPTDLLFAFGSSELSSDAKSRLDSVATALRPHPETSVAVGGYTDTTGPDAYNLDLAQKRARAVRQYLVERGVDAERIVATGYGEAAPVADNETLAGRRSNRRVEIELRAGGVGAFR